MCLVLLSSRLSPFIFRKSKINQKILLNLHYIDWFYDSFNFSREEVYSLGLINLACREITLKVQQVNLRRNTL